MSLSFVSSAVLSSIDGALHNDEKAIEKRGQVGVGQAGVQATFASNSCPIKRKKKRNKRNAIMLLEGDL
jgi:hypothetical protein